MFCPKCGQEMLPQARFCAHCGADIQRLLQQPEKVPSVSQESGPEIPKPQNDPPAPDAPAQEVHRAFSEKTGSSPNISDSDPLAAIIGKNQAYYLPEFQKIRAGEKSRFNWAAFFFGPAFCLYRKCEDLFKKYFLIPIALTLVGYIVQTIGTVQFNLMLITGGGIITGVGGILSFISLIRLGLRFNQLYYERCSGTVSPEKFGTSIKAAIIFYVIVILSVSLIGGAGAIAIRHQYTSILDSDPGNTVSPPTEGSGQFDEFIGSWEDSNGFGLSLVIDYSDGSSQQVYAELGIASASYDGAVVPYFKSELHLTDEGTAFGNVTEEKVGGPSTIEITPTEQGLQVSIYYAELDQTDDSLFVPSVPDGSGRQGASMNTSANAFDDLIGVWEDDYGNYVNVYYTDETMQRVDVDVATAAGEFIAELTLTGDGEASGVVMEGGTEPKYAIDLSRYPEYLEATIYYSEYDFSDTIRLVPGGHGDEIDGPDDTTQLFDLFVGDWFCDESLVGLFIGYKDETKQTAYGALLTLEDEYYDIEMWTDDGETVQGLLMGYGSEPVLALTLTYDGYGLGGTVYDGYSGAEEYMYFSPYDSPGFQNPYYTAGSR